MEIQEVGNYEPLPLLSLNHVSLLCTSVWDSVRFYEDVLGFFLIKRPSSFNFNGAWLYNYGIGIHLLENPSSSVQIQNHTEPRTINPKDNHISFQCTDVEVVKKRLEEMEMRYVTAKVKEGGATVDQVFFHDPDGYMIELCNCEKIPITPISSSSLSSASCTLNKDGSFFNTMATGFSKCGFTETAVMMESLNMDMMNLSF